MQQAGCAGDDRRSRVSRPLALAASRGGYDCGAAAPRTGCTVTTAYAAAAPASGGPCGDPHAAPGSPVLVFSPFAARNAQHHAHHNNSSFVNNNAVEAVAARTASVAAPSHPADRDSLTSDHSAFDARRCQGMGDQSGVQVRRHLIILFIIYNKAILSVF